MTSAAPSSMSRRRGVRRPSPTPARASGRPSKSGSAPPPGGRGAGAAAQGGLGVGGRRSGLPDRAKPIHPAPTTPCGGTSAASSSGRTCRDALPRPPAHVRHAAAQRQAAARVVSALMGRERVAITQDLSTHVSAESSAARRRHSTRRFGEPRCWWRCWRTRTSSWSDGTEIRVAALLTCDSG